MKEVVLSRHIFIDMNSIDYLKQPRSNLDSSQLDIGT